MAKHILRIVAVLMVATILIPLAVAFAYTWHIDFTITESAGNSYTSLPLSGLANNSYLAANGYISATGLNTRVYASDNSVLPHMLTEDKTYFVTPQPALNTQVVTYALGESALSSFDIIPGYSGYITTADDATLELGSVFDISISGYFDTSAGSNKNILYKDNVTAWYISAVDTLSCDFTDSDGSDNFTLTSAIVSGEHTVRVYADGLTAYLDIDGANVDTNTLYTVIQNVLSITGAGYTSLTNHNYGFYAEGLYWVFTSVTGNMTYWTSADGSVWSAATEITTDGLLTQSLYWDTYFDGTNFYYARYADAGATKRVGFRRGAPQSDGSITWAAAEQVIATQGNNIPRNLTVTVDSNGNPWFAYDESYSTWRKVKVHKSSTSDGTWVEDAGFPYSVSGTGTGTTVYNDKPELIPVSGTDDIYLLFMAIANSSGSNAKLQGRLWNGSAWGGVEQFTYSGDLESTTWDNDGNIYIILSESTLSTDEHMLVRAQDASYSDTDLNDNDIFSLAYDPVADLVAIFDTDAGVIKMARWEGSASLTWSQIATGANDGNYSPYPCLLDGQLALIRTYNSAPNASFYHVILSFPWEWNDNANTWYWMQNNVMSYADNMTMAVSGTSQLLYRPDSIISGTTLPDESGNGNDGTFSWGTNPADVDVIPGPLTSDVDNSEPEEGTSPWQLVPTVPSQPSGLFTDGGEGMLGLAELADASEATGNPREMFIIMLAFLLAILLGFAVYGATHNARMGVKGSILLQSITSLVVMIFFYVGGGGVIPGWVLIPFGIEAFFIMLWRNPQHSAT